MQKNMNVQSVINNISFPKSIEELEYFIEEVGHFNIEDILLFPTVEWSMPKWALENDVVFFFHAKTAIQTIHRLESEIRQNGQYDNRTTLLQGLQHARYLYNKYGGKIFAIGRVLGRSFYDGGEWQERTHWHSKIYAKIGDIHILQNPVIIDDFSNFIMISRQSAITPVVGADFEKLKKIIAKSNKIPPYLTKSYASPLPLSHINRNNFLELTHDYRHRFFLEIQFRKFYVDYLLSAIADRKKIFAECACYKCGKLVGYADNCILFNGRFTFVEVKLNFDTEPNLLEQLSKYTNVDSTNLEKARRCSDKIERAVVFAIDTKVFGVFNIKENKLFFIERLNRLKNSMDLVKLRCQIINYLRETDS